MAMSDRDGRREKRLGNVLLYFSSSVTSTPPLGVVLNVILSRKADLSTFEDDEARRGVATGRCEKGVSK